ncbi:MAG TPA: energy transducer TonB [Polyangia bacterium]|nr:energy transducer TonB [Polyangia bacterium]
MTEARRRHRSALALGAMAAGVSLALHGGAVSALLGSQLALLIAGGVLAAGGLFALGWRWWRPEPSGRRSRRGRSRTRAALAASAALLLHLSAVALLVNLSWDETLNLADGKAHAPSDAGPAAEGEGPPLEIESIVNDIQRPVRRSEAEKRAEEEKKKEEDETHPNGKLVDIARPAIEQRPDQADHVAEYDSTVARETHGPQGRDAAGAREEILVPGSQAKPAAAAALPAPKAPQGNPLARPGLPGPLALERQRQRQPLPSGQGGSTNEASGDGNERRPGVPALPSPSVRPSVPGGGGIPGQPGLPNLVPSQEALARAVGKGGGSFDDLRDLDDGESTALNAKKWKFATYFNRIRHAVADQWHPDVVYLHHDPSGNVYGQKDRVTVLRVRLASDGSLAGVNVIESSGADFLDDEAMEAFRRAQPFPNPPSQLIDADGYVHFSFGFIFELSGRTSLKFFKYQ